MRHTYLGPTRGFWYNQSDTTTWHTAEPKFCLAFDALVTSLYRLCDLQRDPQQETGMSTLFRRLRTPQNRACQQYFLDASVTSYSEPHINANTDYHHIIYDLVVSHYSSSECFTEHHTSFWICWCKTCLRTSIVLGLLVYPSRSDTHVDSRV